MSKLTLTLMMLLMAISLMACSGAPAPVENQSSTTASESAPAPAGPMIKVMDSFARAGKPNGAVYMHLMNEGNVDDRLVSAQSDVAEAVELHESKMENDVMKMSPVKAVDISAGGSAALEPGGKHVMLMGIKQELAIGDTFELTLNFENSASQTITVEVTEGATMAMDSGHNMGSEDMSQMDHDMADSDMDKMDHDMAGGDMGQKAN